MTEEDIIIADGYVTDQLPGGKFRVIVDKNSLAKAFATAPEEQRQSLEKVIKSYADNDLVSVAHISGRIRKHRVRVLRGDRVTMEMSIYSLDRGRIIKRL